MKLRLILRDFYEGNVAIFSDLYREIRHHPEPPPRPPDVPCPSVLEYMPGTGLHYLHCEREFSHLGLHKEGERYWGNRAQEREEYAMSREKIRRIRERHRHFMLVLDWIGHLVTWTVVGYLIVHNWYELWR